MKAKIDAKLLLSAINLAGSICPASSNAKITIKPAEDNVSNCDIITSELDSQVHVSFPVTPDDKLDINIIIPASQVENFLKKGSDEVTIEEKTKHYVMKSGDSKLQIPKPEDIGPAFPEIPTDFVYQTELTGARYFGMVADPIEDILPMSATIQGFQVTVTNKEIILFATDGFRIYKINISNDAITKSEPMSMVLPSKILALLKQLDTSDVPLSLGTKGNRYIVRTGIDDLLVELQGTKLEFDYPDISRVLTTKPDHRYLIDANRLRLEAEMHQTVCGDRVAAGIFKFGEKELTIETKGKSLVEGVLSGDTYKPIERTADLKVGIRLKYLIDAIKFCAVLDRGKTAKIEIGFSQAPGALIWIQPSEEIRKANPNLELLAVVAPLRT